jgi:hypothetical protein
MPAIRPFREGNVALVIAPREIARHPSASAQPIG